MNPHQILLLLTLAIFALSASKSHCDAWADGLLQEKRGRQAEFDSDELDDDRPQRVAILYDCSLSMDSLAADERPRRVHAQLALTRLLQRLPERTRFVFVGFNQTCLPLHDGFLSLTPARRRQVLQFTGSLTPRGDTQCAENVALVARRWPALDAVFIISDARSPQVASGERQAKAVGRIQHHSGFELYWLIVDPPPTSNLQRMLRLSHGRRW
jgi:predicted DCC family thiol-disulfide oxidoreductase YuxK